ncbi:TRASH domain-containing protein [Geothrix sp. 21YS21S-4]|uniref:TRASH domain-containing protein n=1 Tax=Geothrix sp. 21YS21S-4 TaxID=3068889 RepID=UPI0027BA817D|nr:TRASH domain-containing protein [Geothrix sp. 21YS21S-4]
MFSALLTLALVAAPGAKPAPATNATCPVLGGKVTETSKTVVVRGREYRLCCAGCDTQLLKDPDKYLDKNGMPKNTKKK